VSNIREIGELMKAVGSVVTAHVGKAFGVLAGRLDLLEQQVKQIPAGANGFDLEAFDLQLKEDGRTLVFSFKDAQRELVKEVVLPIVLDAGVYRAEQTYVKGDGVTYSGSFWIAQKDAPGTPGQDDGWRLAVKKGRDLTEGGKR
jgi:hypothetical protein